MVKWLDANSIFYRRIKDAYPNFIIKIKKLNNNIKEINEQAKEKYKKKVIK